MEQYRVVLLHHQWPEWFSLLKISIVGMILIQVLFWVINRLDKYYPRILNVHPGDTTKGYDGLHWIPSAKAILAGDEVIRSTLFFVDKGEDSGPVLVQSAPLNILQTIDKMNSGRTEKLSQELDSVTGFAKAYNIKTYEHFVEKAGEELLKSMEHICESMQDALKVEGDWKIYPFAVHDLIAKGRVRVEGRTLYIDDKIMPEYGYRLNNY